MKIEDLFFALNLRAVARSIIEPPNLGYLVREVWGEDKITISMGGWASKNRRQPALHPRTDSSFVLALAKIPNPSRLSLTKILAQKIEGLFTGY